MGRASVIAAVATGLAGAAAAALYVYRRCRRPALTLRTTPPTVDQILFGASALAGFTYSPCSADEARAAVHAALDLGVRCFDTAPHYGLGLSEQRLGEALASHAKGPEARVWTKVGRVIVPRSECRARIRDGRTREEDVEWDNMHGHPACIFPGTDPDLAEIADFTAEGANASHKQSVRRLRREGVPMGATVLAGQRVHDPDTDARCGTALGPDGAVAALVRLRARGEIGEVSIGCWSVRHVLRLLHETPPGSFDSVMLAGRWNLLDQSGLALVAECERRGVAVHNASIFGSGLLAGGTTYQNKDAPADVLRRAQAWGALAERFGTTLPAVAIHFALLPKVVTLAAMGMRSAEEVRNNVESISRPVDPALWQEAKRLGLLDPAVPVPEPVPSS